MARSPRRSSGAGAGGPRTPEGVQIEILLDNSYVRVTRTTMQPGAEIPPASRNSHYVIHPITPFNCTRRFVRRGATTREVAIDGVPGKPYFGRATRGESKFALVNKSNAPIVFDKVILKKTGS